MAGCRLQRGSDVRISRDQRGSTSVEYAAIASIISIAAIGGMSAVGIRVFDLIRLVPLF
jgi:Flp pilus assembly protein TadG